MLYLLKQLIEIIVHRKYHLQIRFLWQKLSKKIDPEMLFIEKILNKKRGFVDIGANVGIYTYYFSEKFSAINAFEPLEEITYRIKSLNKSNIIIHNKALSSKKGKLKFYIPLINGLTVPPLASLEKKKKPYKKKIVDVVTLDEFNFKNVDLIKIDVEGHEYFVLKGAIKTIKKNKPFIICEIEKRHSTTSLNKIIKLFKKLNYEGIFLYQSKINSINTFKYNIHQKPYIKDVENKKYINNFIFYHKSYYKNLKQFKFL